MRLSWYLIEQLPMKTRNISKMQDMFLCIIH